MDKRSGLETLTIPHVCIDGATFLAATDCSAAGILAPSQCIDIEWPDLTVSIIVKPCPLPTNNCTVVFTGGQGFDKNGTLAKRYFHRHSWIPQDTHVICVSDPIYFLDNTIQLGFYAVDIFGPQYIPQIITKLLTILGCSKLCLIGASAGGWAVLKYLSESVFPSTRMGICICGQVNPTISRVAGSCRNIGKYLDKSLDWNINISKLDGCNILYIQNEYDTHYLTTQFVYFSRPLRSRNIKMYLFNSPSEIVLADHHGYGLPQTVLNGLLKLVNDVPITDATEQAELERHRFRPYNSE